MARLPSSRMPMAELWRITKFALVGGISVAVYFLIIFVMAPIISSTVVLAAVAYVGSAIFNYVLQRNFTFRARIPHALSFSRYIGMHVIALVINSGLMVLLVDVATVNLYVAILIVAGFIAVMNFLLSRFWVYANR
jgi:putative flippase GtrA